MRDPRRLPRQFPLLVVMLLALLLGASLVAAEQAAAPGWQANFGTPNKVRAAGEYKESVVWNLESHSPLTLEPSPSGIYEILEQNGKSYLAFHDSIPALTPNPAPPPFFRRSEGSICALGWVNQEMGDQVMTGVVNAEGRVAHSRQGLMARWDLSNSFYWLYIDFSNGYFGIMRSRSFGVMDDLEGGRQKVQDFEDNRPYFLELAVIGNELEGRVFEVDEKTWEKTRMVGHLAKVKDPDPVLRGHSGFLIETATEKPYVTLKGSVARMVVTTEVGAERMAASQGPSAEAKVASDAGH